jgi:hypothetical protein
MFMLALVGVPLAYLAVLVALLARRDPRGILISVIFGAATIASAVWAIKQSRSSTAAIGYLGIPFIGALGAFLGLAFGRWRSSTDAARKIGAWAGLAAALLIVAFNVAEGSKTRAKNAVRDDKQAEFSAEVARDRELIDAALKQNPGREREYLDSSIKARMTDRAFLLAALPHDSISPQVLDTVASSTDIGITLEAIRNPNASAETLTRIYRTHTYPDYFFQALASHRHTPPEILRNLHRNPGVISGIDMWLAGNPATPKDVLDEIARTATDPHVIAQLLENPSLDCGLLTQVGVRLTKAPPRDPPDPNVMRATERLPDVCLAKAKL